MNDRAQSGRNADGAGGAGNARVEAGAATPAYRVTRDGLRAWLAAFPVKAARGPKTGHPSHAKAAEALGVAPRTLSHWLNGDRPIPIWVGKHVIKP